ncbi:DUF2851 family protein [Rubrivirga sp. S365]|uniref:DUF2851 family protein n=1 Tax=Rubrivirga litoralis TaxID=3075598 RepID=A0ABU3BRG1_9BACT|nr:MULTISPECIES: DUF2851 family protein [unclassified Rubrivirga]MDT0631878.1 DUF2851 family protein [Rubrivirga sp. F394]MDT7857931.1 DUF2851 family protein [Rubrivirga sp. S365]
MPDPPPRPAQTPRAAGAVHEPPVGGAAEVAARVPEALIQDAWVRGLFDARALRTTDGEVVRVIDRGRLNRDSGPDVAGARVEIGGLVWAGDVEIHRTSAEWESHGHDADPAYRRVVLHVVLAADRRTGTLRRSDGSALPELVLLPHLDRSLRSLLRAFYVEPREAPHCAARWPDVDAGVVRAWVRALGVQRLRERTRALGRAYGHRPDLDRLLVARVFRALGYAANADAMEELARRFALSAPPESEVEVRDRLLALSGLDAPDLFDAGGAAAGVEPALGGAAMRPEAWRRGGRPANAPRTRIVQAAALLGRGGLLRDEPVARLAEALGRGLDGALDLVRPAPAARGPRLGADRARTVWVDAVLPVLLLDAEQRESPAAEDAVAQALDALPAASDRVARRFRDAGFRPGGALESQGLHQLARAYCDEGRCARCAVGLALYPGLAGGVEG